MPIQLPGQNQPIDYDFISQIALTLNKLEERMSMLDSNNESNLNGKNTKLNNVGFFTKSLDFTIGKVLKSSQDIRFEGVSFTQTPIVTATLNAEIASTVFLITVTNISATGCTINIISSPIPTAEVSAKINIIAIGPRG